MEQILISFFQRIAKKDENELTNLKNYEDFRFEPNCWFFTLPNLFTYLQQQNEIGNEINYKQFRQQLFNCPINKNLKRLVAEVTIHDNKSNVDKSEYVFVWKEKN